MVQIQAPEALRVKCQQAPLAHSGAALSILQERWLQPILGQAKVSAQRGVRERVARCASRNVTECVGDCSQPDRSSKKRNNILQKCNSPTMFALFVKLSYDLHLPAITGYIPQSTGKIFDDLICICLCV